ncbi:DUF1772 domain-containing protein [Prauserella aidingensis]|uniref:DUF1772 domain-containing protein n=1 Tax=Prauserella aidingensis TaxID=387890 RepID=UPI0020A54115|nr:DUF1772 domain-containing protein [Prauserella aidingensis]
MVGVELAVAVVVHPVLLRLPVGAALDGRAHEARMLGRTMPVWYVASLLLTAALTIATWGTSAAVTAGIATALLVISVVMSATLLVPINNRTATWTADDHPPDWRDVYRRWDRLHYVRVTVLVGAFVLVLAAATAV